MKKFLFTALAISLISTLALANVNPGEDPNEAKVSKETEAGVGNVGTCPECIARMKHGRLGDDTTYRTTGKDTDKKSESSKGTQ